MANIFSLDNLVSILYRIPAILVALSFHEWAHAYAAYRLGDPTARNLGRLSLNPFAHIDPFGLLMLLLVRFGWAKPVPINTRNFAHPRRDEIVVSLAGVITNFILAFIFTGILYLCVLVFGVSNEIFFNIMYMFIFINLGLCVFNLIPIPPLDGYHVLQCLLMRKIGPKVFLFLERYGFIILIVLLVTGALSGLLSTVVSWIAQLFETVYMFIFRIIGVV